MLVAFIGGAIGCTYGLGHGDDGPILEIQDTVLLEDWAKHSLDNDGWAGVGDEGGLLVELLREEVDTEVTVLAGSRGCSDADDLARTALEDQEIAQADVVAWDGNSVWGVGRLGGNGWATSRLDTWLATYCDVNLLATMVMMMSVMEWVSNLFGSTVETMAERVVVTL
jgi:hypothetical protein